MKWIKYDITTTTKDADMIGEILSEFNISGYEISDRVPLTKEEEKAMYTDIPAELEPDDGTSILTFYTEAPGNDTQEFFSTGSSLRDSTLEEQMTVLQPDDLVQSILQRIQELSFLQTPTITYCVQDDSLWKDKWKENFKPFHVADDIIIKPTWEDIPSDVKKDDIIIEIDPGSAFGTGTHETTKLCLLALRKYITPETTILDAGCGSGILAIAALLCGAKSAFCLDIDPAAVEGTLENAQKNHISSDRLQAIHANILENHKEILAQCHAPFHITVANILADVIVPLTDYIGEFMNEDSIFISSGILAEKADMVERSLHKNNFTIIEKNTMGDWVSFVAKKTIDANNEIKSQNATKHKKK
ncbi:50S ribosomal protein L11 methyltransferase [Jutongia hominis]|uniref:Ribosomal protein L11 methyltransferase n=1 Tax=Jutongia hominis TaxID=2763664 RepID=A0ABR7MQR7_9FIRM|nr:50S ribosomal protein L11 methyltransferase [Jutongia hominis]MBC8556139.1 50S ribosomal protein L11 methyltransferase [Jutongia hominis]